MDVHTKTYNYVKMFIRAIYAGFMIGIGGIIFLSIENKILGSLFFSFGLLTIVTQGLNLFTGKIGFIQKWREMLDMMLIIVGNTIGAYFAAFLAKAAHFSISSAAIVEKKLDNSIYNIFLLALFCGIMMYLAIDNNKKGKNLLFIIAPVMIFILGGFEHSIASMFYFFLADEYSPKAIIYIIVMLAGNGVGSRLFAILQKWE